MKQPFLDKQFYRVNFGQGLDTKTDAKVLSSGKMVALQNAQFTQANAINKRNGFAAVGSPDSTDLISNLQSFQGNVFGIGSPTANSAIRSMYSLNAAGSLAASAPSFNDFQVTSSQVISNSQAQPQADSASANGYTLHAWLSNVISNTITSVYYEVVQIATGQVIVPQTQLLGAGFPAFTRYSDVRCLAIGSNIVLGATQAGQLSLATFNTVTQSLVYSGTFGWTPIGSGFVQWDWLAINGATTSSQRILLSYVASATLITVAALSNTASVVSTTFYTHNATSTFSTIGMATPYAASSTMFNLLYLDGFTGYAWQVPMNSSLSFGTSVSNNTSSGSFLISGQERSDGSVLAFSCGAAGTGQDSTFSTLFRSGVGTLVGTGMGGIAVHSKPIYKNDNSIYFWGLYSSLLQAQYILFQWIGTYSINSVTYNNAILPAARILYGNAVGISTTINQPWTRLAVSVDNLGSGRYRLDCISSGIEYPSSTGIIQNGAVSQLNMNFGYYGAYASATQNNQQIIAGGFNALNDGGGITELGFFLYPENITTVISTTGGNLGTGVYQYVAIYGWYDNIGNLHRSETSVPVTVTTTTGTTNKVSLNIANLNATLKQSSNYNRVNAFIEVYRDTVNASPVIYYLISNTPTVSSVAGGFVTIVDTISDTNIAFQQILYTEGGVEDNYTLDGTAVICAGPDRLFASDPNNNGIVHVGQPYIPTDGLTFFSGITQLLPTNDGPITGMIYMDTSLIVFKARSIYACQGLGPTSNGQNNQLTPFQLITDDMGCDNPNACTLYPGGILFKSAKGYYRLGHDLSFNPKDNYIGESVESYNSYSCLRALHVPDRNQVRFALSDNATILCYDYFFEQWSTIQSSVTDMTTVGGNFYLASNTPSIGALVGQETVGTFVDALLSPTGIPWLIQSGWFALNQLQGMQRVYRLRFLGDFKSTHTIAVNIAYDYEGSAGNWTFNETHTLTSANITASGSAYQFEIFPLRQKCEAIMWQITDGTPTGESFDLTDCEIEVGLIPGRRFPLAASKGG